MGREMTGETIGGKINMALLKEGGRKKTKTLLQRESKE